MQQGMKPYADNFIPIIPVAPESMTHTKERPFCINPTCLCHEDKELTSLVERAYLAGEVTREEATNTILGKML